jgi:hypothetical protein
VFSFKLDKSLAHRAAATTETAAAQFVSPRMGASSFVPAPVLEQFDCSSSEMSAPGEELSPQSHRHHHHHRHGSFFPLAESGLATASTSFAGLMHPTWVPQDGDDRARPLTYEPSLDDPVFKTGKHRTVMTLPGFKCSIVPFIRPSILRDELNEQFRQQHREVHDAGVTLSKLRKAKAKILAIVTAGHHELSSAAISFCLIDRLLRTGMIDKPAFKTVAAVCLYLAIKFNEPVSPASLRHLRESISKTFDIPAVYVVTHEFQ